MRIKNINDMTEKPCRCGSWLEHWKNLSHLPLPHVCQARGCQEAPVAGAFAQKDNYFDEAWFVVPLCHKHNRLYGASLDLAEGVVLVSAKASKSCVNPMAEAPAPSPADHTTDAEAVH
jgi:hypothetical protein